MSKECHQNGPFLWPFWKLFYLEKLVKKTFYCHTPAKLRPKPSWVGCIIGFDKTQTQVSLHISTTSTVPGKLNFFSAKKNVHTNFFPPKYFFDPHFFSAKFFLTQILFLSKNLLTQILFLSKNLLTQILFRPKNILIQKNLWPTFFSDTILFDPKKIFDKIFFRPTFSNSFFYNINQIFFRFVIWNLGPWIQNLGFGIWDLGFGIEDLGLGIWNLDSSWLTDLPTQIIFSD